MDGANFEGADLSGACFGQTAASNANLSYAKLRGAILDEVTFRNANFSHTDLSGAMLNFVLNEAIFCETIMPDGSIRSDGF